MTKPQLHSLRREIDNIYHLTLDELSGTNRLRFLRLLAWIDQ